MKNEKFSFESYLPLKNFIGGEFIPSLQNKWIDNWCPSTGEIYSQIARSQSEDVDLAITYAQKAFATWKKTSKTERSKILHRIADLLEENIDLFARAESYDQGKPFLLAKNMDMKRSIENFRFFADLILDDRKEYYKKENFQSEVIYKPVGVVGLIAPWNLPLYLLTWKIAPALASGNVVICKPSEFTSLTAVMLGEIAKKAGLPSGVLNIILGFGSEVGEAMVAHPEIKAISFTGGTVTGQKVFEQSAKNFKKISLELGGKNPNIIFADCDLQKSIEISLRSSFLNQGEICLCGSRIYVEKAIYSQFVGQFVEQVKKLKVGDPSDETNFMGALISQAHLEKVLRYIQIAKNEGGQILTGGQKPRELPSKNQNGFYLEPTVIVGLKEDSSCIQEEIFGPVVTISSFENEEDVLNKANSVKYGLSATVWTFDSQRARRMAEGLDVGTVWINQWLMRDLRVPFGGTKHSGIGREGGFHSLDFFTEPTTFVTTTS